MISEGTFRHKKGFTTCPNCVVDDERLDMATLGLYCKIQSKVTIPNSQWKKSYFLNEALKNPKNTKNSFNESWRRLKECGYLKIYIHSTGKGTWREYDLLDEPDSGPSEIRVSSKTDNEIAESPANTEDFQGSKFQHLGNPTVGFPDSGIPEAGISESGLNNIKDINNPEEKNNNKNFIQTEFNLSGHVSQREREKRQDGQEYKNEIVDFIKDQVEYNTLIQNNPDDTETIDGLINIIADIVTTKPNEGYERINGRDYSHEVVKSRLLKMDYFTMGYVLDKLKDNTTKIRNMRAYLLTVLYNAKDERELSVMNQVNHDMYGGGWAEKGIV